MNIKSFNLGRYVIPEECKSGIAIDIGANVGSFCNKYASTFAKIYGYEAVKKNYEVATRANQSNENVTIYNLAVWSDDKGISGVYEHSSSECGSCSVLGSHVEHSSGWKSNLVTENHVDSISLKKVVDNALTENCAETIAYLKMDCECAEYPILMNTEDSVLNKIRFIGIEIHNQLGRERYFELVDHIQRTHELCGNPNSIVYIKDKNQTYLFRKKVL